MLYQDGILILQKIQVNNRIHLMAVNDHHKCMVSRLKIVKYQKSSGLKIEKYNTNLICDFRRMATE